MENAENLVAIKRYRVGAKGARGRSVALPQVWIDELGLKLGDVLVLYRRPGCDDLIVRPERKKRKAS